MGDRALSIRQPWAWLIAHGFKDVENRSWLARVRGLVLIHAPKTFDAEGYAWVREAFPNIPLPRMVEFERGGVVGRATLVDCVSESESPWFFGPYGFVFADAVPLELTPCRGHLGFFTPEVGRG